MMNYGNFHVYMCFTRIVLTSGSKSMPYAPFARLRLVILIPPRTPSCRENIKEDERNLGSIPFTNYHPTTFCRKGVDRFLSPSSFSLKTLLTCNIPCSDKIFKSLERSEFSHAQWQNLHGVSLVPMHNGEIC